MLMQAGRQWMATVRSTFCEGSILASTYRLTVEDFLFDHRYYQLTSARGDGDIDALVDADISIGLEWGLARQD